MNSRVEFDVGPLSWVKGEIDQSLARSLDALKKFAANNADKSLLKASQTHLHQAHGALQVVGLDGVTRVSEELESFLTNLERETLPCSGENFRRAQRGYAALSDYLDQLINGVSNQPLRLLGAYGELLAASGREADPTDLYYPDLANRAPRRADVLPQMPPEQASGYFRDQRSRFQRGLL